MERLTEKTTDNSSLNAYKIQSKNLNYHCVAKDKRGDITYYGQHVNKLAEYENLEELIGIPLKDIAEIFRQNIPEDCKYPRKAIMLTDDDVDKWNGYKNAEEQGLMLRLPCKIGDTVYCIEDKKIWNCIVDKVTISRTNGIWFEVKTPKSMPDISAIEYAENDIGKTVFLTQEEAEQKLKEMESD